MMQSLDRSRWLTAAEALRLMGRERDYGRLHWLYRRGMIKNRQEVSERKFFYDRTEIVKLVATRQA